MHEAKHLIIVRNMMDFANQHNASQGGELEKKLIDQMAMNFINASLVGEYTPQQELMRRDAILEYWTIYGTAKRGYGQNNG